MITTVQRTILFADIVESVQLYASWGDGPARRIVAQAMARLAAAADANRGTVVKTIGDGLMCTFPDPNDAACAARVMHHNLEDLSASARLTHHLNAHIGLHHGDVIQEAGDVFGDAVNMAARLVDCAKPRETVTSEATLAMLRPDEQARAHFTDQTTLRGKPGQFRIFELTWEDLGLTTAPLLEAIEAACPSRLRIWRGTDVREVSLSNATVTIGRRDHNAFMVEGQSVSRTHARIEWRRGKFYLLDVSTNGTHVCQEGTAGLWVKREVYELRDRGTIGLGEPVLRDCEETVYYEVLRQPQAAGPVRRLDMAARSA